MKKSLIEAAMKPERKNWEIEAAVNRGLAAAMLHDAGVAAEIMQRDGVPPHVITRVLLSPQFRRSTDWQR